MTELLVLHAIRLRGMSAADGIAERFDLDPDATAEILLDQQAFGHVSWSEFGSSSGWSLTERGKAYAEQQLADELEAAGAPEAVDSAYTEFLSFNARLRETITKWQLRPRDDDPFVENDHRDRVWDVAVLAELRVLSRALVSIEAAATAVLPRFRGYDRRFARALHRGVDGDREWVDGVGIDSCHTVWFEMHEDFLATLGKQR